MALDQVQRVAGVELLLQDDRGAQHLVQDRKERDAGDIARPARRSPLAISAPAMELKDIQATRSPSPQPRPVNAFATRLARRFRVAKSRTSSPQTTAGLSGSDSAWLARKSNSAVLILGGVRGAGGRARRR